jgi:hypothetical protein
MDTTQAQRLSGLRVNAFAALIMVLIQYCLGMWVNLGVNVPASDRGANLLDAIVRTVANGPIGLSLHALLGLFLIVSAAAAFFRAVRIGLTRWTVLTGVGLAAVVLAAVSGARFVSADDDAASLAMALFAAAAMFAYGLILFRVQPAPDY